MKSIKKIFKKILVSTLAAVMVLGPSTTVFADGVEGESTGSSDVYVSFGADLNDSEKATVMSLFGITDADLTNYKVGQITNEDEHKYLGEYLPENVIGSRALSCVMVTKGEKGSGIKVDTQNISYCTAGMYTNALITAGIEDATVKVVGPFNISGTAALVGAMKAYAEMTGEEISDEAMDTAVNELVVTGQVAENTGDSEKTEELIAYVKNKMVEEGWDNPEDIRAALDEAATTMDVELTEEDKDKIVELMGKIDDLDLDIDALKAQASDLYDKIQSLDTAEVENFFTKIINGIKDFFSKLFD